jgi:hypothetical protein
MLSEELKQTIEDLTTADVIRLHFFVKDKFEDLKKSTPNFSSAVWATLNTETVKKNNILQQQKFRQKKKLANATATV